MRRARRVHIVDRRSGPSPSGARPSLKVTIRWCTGVGVALIAGRELATSGVAWDEHPATYRKTPAELTRVDRNNLSAGRPVSDQAPEPGSSGFAS